MRPRGNPASNPCLTLEAGLRDTGFGVSEFQLVAGLR